MSIVGHALDAAPAGGHRELWLAARPVVRRSVCRLVPRGVEPRRHLVVIADHGTVIAEVIQMLSPKAVVHAEEPLVAVLVGEQRHVVAAVLGGLEEYMATVPAGSVVVVTVPVGVSPMAAMVKVVDRRMMS